jgi:hypothetical protein
MLRMSIDGRASKKVIDINQLWHVIIELLALL